ncbi:MAG TPA: WxL domain-containing protein [Ktedonobacteraceae bacterium]|nr:WxL domain-containing protein [Ktedonobacteraceae bacterium]
MQTRIPRLIALCASSLLLVSVVIAMTVMGTMEGNSPRAYAMPFATPVATSTTGASAYVTPGPLSMDLTPVTQPTAITLNGTDQAETFSLPIVVDDDTGSGAGWDLTLSLTTFTNSGHTLATDVAEVSAQPTAICNSGTCTNPSVSGISYPLVLTADGSTTSKFFNADTGTGMGNFTVTTPFSVTIPANAYAGTYSSTFTVSITSGP